MTPEMKQKVAAAFTEWVRRYEADPAGFSEEFGPAEDYGRSSADYLEKLMGELDR